ncbi:MAG TPA: hypothetical protein DFR83_00725 [Deltaproteobacteria bacterium]|nr:hypothetical protein [Deltaproteobacteria bacterium]
MVVERSENAFERGEVPRARPGSRDGPERRGESVLDRDRFDGRAVGEDDRPGTLDESVGRECECWVSRIGGAVVGADWRRGGTRPAGGASRRVGDASVRGARVDGAVVAAEVARGGWSSFAARWGGDAAPARGDGPCGACKAGSRMVRRTAAPEDSPAGEGSALVAAWSMDARRGDCVDAAADWSVVWVRGAGAVVVGCCSRALDAGGVSDEAGVGMGRAAGSP